MPEFWIFLSSGLFLGWSLGANDGSNVFGTAVGTRMVKFRTAAVISSVFVIIGAVFAGSGAAETLNELGSVNAPAGAFMVGLAAALSVYWMNKSRPRRIFRHRRSHGSLLCRQRLGKPLYLRP